MQANELPGILSDRQIRALCEVPVAEIQFRDLRTRGVTDDITLPIYANEFAPITDPVMGRHDPHLLKLAKAYGGEKDAEYGPRIEIVRMYDDAWVKQQQAEFKPMITPFEPEACAALIRPMTEKEFATLQTEHPDGAENRTLERSTLSHKAVSFGLSSFGYDVRLAEDFKIFSNVNSAIVDPKRFDDNCLVDGKLHTDKDGSRYVIMPPNSYLLGHTIEVFDIPNDVLVLAIGKSTYARAGAIVNVTPIEPGFKGTVVIEISNSTPSPLKIYANEGISQFVFFRGTQPCEVSYGDRAGKYQNQRGIVLPKV